MQWKLINYLNIKLSPKISTPTLLCNWANSTFMLFMMLLCIQYTHSPILYAVRFLVYFLSKIFCKINKNNGSSQTSNIFRRKSLFTSHILVAYHCCRLRNRKISFSLIESKCTFILFCSTWLSPFWLVIVN